MNKNKKFISTFIILLIVGLIVVILPLLNKENNVVQTFKNFDPIKIITNNNIKIIGWTHIPDSIILSFIEHLLPVIENTILIINKNHFFIL